MLFHICKHVTYACLRVCRMACVFPHLGIHLYLCLCVYVCICVSASMSASMSVHLCASLSGHTATQVTFIVATSISHSLSTHHHITCPKSFYHRAGGPMVCVYTHACVRASMYYVLQHISVCMAFSRIGTTNRHSSITSSACDTYTWLLRHLTHESFIFSLRV